MVLRMNTWWHEFQILDLRYPCLNAHAEVKYWTFCMILPMDLQTGVSASVISISEVNWQLLRNVLPTMLGVHFITTVLKFHRLVIHIHTEAVGYIHTEAVGYIHTEAVGYNTPNVTHIHVLICTGCVLCIKPCPLILPLQLLDNVSVIILLLKFNFPCNTPDPSS